MYSMLFLLIKSFLSVGASIDFIPPEVLLSFSTGDRRACYNTTIVDDDICEEQSETFFSSLTVATGESILIDIPLTEVIISDDMEPECGQCIGD